MKSTDEKFLNELAQTLTASSGEEKNRRIRALEQLAAIPFTDPSHTVELLCETINKLGTIEPEITLVTKGLRKAVRSTDAALDRLTKLVEERHAGALHCACRILISFDVGKQSRLGPSLAKELFRRETADSLAEAIAAVLAQLKHPDAKRAVIKEISKYLDSPDQVRIKYAVAILSRIGDRAAESALLRVLSKLLDGYYGGYRDPIMKDLCSYFAKILTTSAVPRLLQGIEKGWHRCFAETLGAICDAYPELQRNVLRLAKRTSDISVKLDCVYGLATMHRALPRVKEIAAIIKDDDLKYEYARTSFKSLLMRNSKESRPLLADMLRSNDERRYEFALEVLKEMHLPIWDVAKSLGTQPVRAIYEYFWARKEAHSFDYLWQEKAKLGETIKGKTTRFEYLLQNLLSCLGFITLNVDPSRRAGVDIVAFPPTWSYALLIGATTGTVEDNLEKLANTVADLYTALGDLARKVEIVPIVATSLSGETNPKNADYARSHRIVTLRQSDIDRLVDWVNTSRSYKKFLTYLDVRLQHL